MADGQPGPTINLNDIGEVIQGATDALGPPVPPRPEPVPDPGGLPDTGAEEVRVPGATVTIPGPMVQIDQLGTEFIPLEQAPGDLRGLEVRDDKLFLRGFPVDFQQPALPAPTRILVNSTFDKPVDKQAFIQKIFDADPDSFDGYEVIQDPSGGGDILIFNPNKRTWLPLDPNVFTGAEIGSEIAENAQEIVSGVAAVSPLAGVAVGAGLEGLRQTVAEALLPEGDAFSPGKLIAAGGAGAIAPTATKTTAAASRAGLTAAGRTRSAVGRSKFIQKGTENVIGFFRSPKRIAKEIGAPKAAFKRVGRRPITDNIEWMVRNRGEVLEDILNKLTIEQRADTAIKRTDELRERLTQFLTESRVTANAADVFDTKQFRELTRLANKKTLNRSVRENISSIREDMVNTLADNILSTEKLLAFKSGAIGEKHLLAIAETRQIPLLDIFELRRGADELVNYVDEFKDLAIRNKAIKFQADAYRETFRKALTGRGGKLGKEILDAQEEFFNLIPIRDILDAERAASLSNKALLESGIPGTLKGIPRRTFNISERIARSPQFGAVVRGLGEAGEKLTEEGRRRLASQLGAGALRAFTFVVSQQFLEKNMGIDEASAMELLRDDYPSLELDGQGDMRITDQFEREVYQRRIAVAIEHNKIDPELGAKMMEASLDGRIFFPKGLEEAPIPGALPAPTPAPSSRETPLDTEPSYLDSETSRQAGNLK